MPRLDLVPVVVDSVSWIARWAAQWPMVFTSGCLLSGDFSCSVLVTCLISFVFQNTTILRRYSKQRSYSPTRVALTDPYTTTSSCSAEQIRVSCQTKGYRYVPKKYSIIYVLKTLQIKHSLFIRKLLELMPDLEFWELILLQYCSFSLGPYWNALFWFLLLYYCSQVVLQFVSSGCLDRSCRDIFNQLFNVIACAISRTIRVLLKSPVKLSLKAYYLFEQWQTIWIFFVTCVCMETST